MPSLRQALIAAGDVELQALVGRETLDLLKAWGDQAISVTGLADLLLARYGSTLLSLPRFRELIFLSLQPSDAQLLSRRLGLSPSANPYEQLLRLRSEARSAQSEIICDFFGVTPVEEDRPPAIMAREDISPYYALRDYQRQVVQETVSALLGPERRVLLHLPTGAGKTRVAMAVLAQILASMSEHKVIVWLAHSEELCEQAAQEFAVCWRSLGNRRVEVFRFFGEHEVDLGSVENGILIGGLAKLYSRSLRSQSEFLSLKRRACVVVMDEAHQAIAPTYKHLLEMLAPDTGGVSLLGLSATPGRSLLNVEEDERLAKFFRGQKVTLKCDGFENPISYLEEHQYLSKAKYVKIPHSPATQLAPLELSQIEQTLDLPASVLSRLAEDEQRNLLILDCIKSEWEQGSKIIVFACNVQHAQVLADVLQFRGVRAALVTGETPRAERQSALKRFKGEAAETLNVIVNCEVLTTGFDAPRTNVAVIARPTSSVVLYSQMCGRALRGPLSGGNSHSRIYTVVDQLPGFKSASDGFGFWDDIWG